MSTFFFLSGWQKMLTPKEPTEGAGSMKEQLEKLRADIEKNEHRDGFFLCLCTSSAGITCCARCPHFQQHGYQMCQLPAS